MTSARPSGPVRTRDAAATRRALLAAGRELFASEGFDRTTVRAVAERAGVNQSLLFRYFGNKEGLFAEAIRDDALAVLEGPRRDLLERTVATIFHATSAPDPEPLLAVLRGASSSQIGAEVRTQLAEAYISAFADLVDTPDRADAVLRAELFLSWLLGISLSRSADLPGHSLSEDAAQAHILRAARALLGPPPAGLDTDRPDS